MPELKLKDEAVKELKPYINACNQTSAALKAMVKMIAASMGIPNDHLLNLQTMTWEPPKKPE